MTSSPRDRPPAPTRGRAPGPAAADVRPRTATWPWHLWSADRATGRGAGLRRPPRRRPPHRWRVLLWRARLPFAAVMLGCAVALALADLRPEPPPSTAVVVAARPLAAGAAITAADLAVVHVAPETVAEGAHADPAAVVGRAVVVAVPSGLPVVDALLRDDRLATAGPPGTVVVPVRLADPGVAELLRPGDRVDLFAAATSATGAPVAERIAQRALVLPLPAPATDRAESGLLGTAPADTGTLTLVAVVPEQAAALAGASAWAGISAVVVE